MIQKVEMSFAITAFSILNSVRFVTSTLTKTETFSPMFAMNVTWLPSVLNYWEKSRL